MNKLIEFFKIISDETRLRIIMLLWQKPLCVCELCYILQLSQPKVSRHLAKLRDVGLVKDDRQSQWIFYCLNIEDEVKRKIVQQLADNIQEYSVLQEDLEKFKSRTVDYKELCKEQKKERGVIMNIKILGAGCEKCTKLEQNVKEAVKELGIEAEVQKVEDLKSIMTYGVMTTPTLVVDEKVKVSGRVLSKEEVKKYLK